MGYYSLIQSTGSDQSSEINKIMGCCKISSYMGFDVCLQTTGIVTSKSTFLLRQGLAQNINDDYCTWQGHIINFSKFFFIVPHVSIE